MIIDYTYDPLNRLMGADYSDGRSFNYTYDASGNVLELEQNLGPGTIVTTYTYDTANQLTSAQQGSTSWQYTYDANGSLISDGVKNYTYDSANRLIEVSEQSTVTSLSYNGLGQRLSMDAAGVIAQYVLDGDRPLTAETGGNTTFYLYGLGAIGEKTTAWNFSLPDGTNTPRQLTNSLAEITLASRYTPWGETLDSFGTGNFSYGYLGGVLDAATGLIYVGNGQYYDPSTGRFLTRDVNPNNTNPYVPWNPIGAILGPMGLISLVASRRKKGGKVNPYLLMFIMLVVLPLGIGLACSEEYTPTQTQPEQPPVVVTPGGPGIDTGMTSTPVPPSTPLAVPCPEKTFIYLGDWKITYYHIALEWDPEFPANDKVPVSGLDPNKTYRRQFIYSFPGIYGQGTGKSESGEYITIDHTKNEQVYGSGWLDSNPALWYFIYGKGGRNSEPVPWKTVAMNPNQTGLTWNDKVKIDGYDPIFEVTDTGTFPDTEHLDVFLGEVFHAEALRYGTSTRSVWKVIER